ncbi:MAG: tRNA (adenosine(37)-N6)-dimethylallyltransferase MiaA [Cytophagales bacterium]|nr:tRNA (adenosine(37)-N6)-dimethylallyltransferase MiaA [Cytophagales bacterium]MDW8385035.1 tRNA (adenosine(37)-N6)-dimethylallyltransferase MiaA [Flammeovirgaceae bacterium]
MKKIVVFIVGPTAVGKTDVAVRLAQHYLTEVISADSRQFYKEMLIGTARPTPLQMQGVPHHLVGHISVQQPYDVADFEKDALSIIEQILQKKNIVLVVGGSGLYLKTLAEGIDQIPKVDWHVRHQILQKYQQEGLTSLLEELSERDAVYFQQVDKANPQRIIRALEVCRATGKPYSTFRTGKKVIRPFDILKIGLILPREELYFRINRRVEQMVAAGLQEEALSLIKYRDVNALQTVGYREIFEWYDGKYSWQECIKRIQQNTRHFAKRQLTWFRKDTSIQWFAPQEIANIISWIDRF